LWCGGERRQQALKIRFGEEKRVSQPAASPKLGGTLAQPALGDPDAARGKARDNRFGRQKVVNGAHTGALSTRAAMRSTMARSWSRAISPVSDMVVSFSVERKSGRRYAKLCRPAGGSRA
jgi:hypothetical protein